MIKLSSVNVITAIVHNKQPVIIFEYNKEIYGGIHSYTNYISDYVKSEYNLTSMNLCVQDVINKLFTS